jgi:hypothetical protein
MLDKRMKNTTQGRCSHYVGWIYITFDVHLEKTIGPKHYKYNVGDR